MTITDIPRVKPGITNDKPTGPCAELAQRANDLLGYSTLLSRASGSISIAAPGRLAAVLMGLEIDVLDMSKVIDYQMEEAGRRTRALIERDLSQWCNGWFTSAHWTATSLSSYKEPIPEFVLAKAIQIKEQLPEVKFFVQHLNDPKADPFLVAQLGSEIYYIEVWSEPKFEHSL